MNNKNLKVPKIILWFTTILGILWSAIIIIIPLIPKYKDKIIPYVNDTFAVANIQNPVIWQGYESVIGFLLLLSIITALFFRSNILHYSMLIFAGVAVSLQLTLYMIVPKIEQHVQGSMIDFYKSIQNKDCYVKVLGFKSYAPYYYTNRQPSYHTPNAEDELWLMSGEIDKDVYFVTKNDRDYYRLNPNLEIVLDKGGYVAYKRKFLGK